MESAEIVRRFLAYFEQHGHTVVPSASLIADDPTLLLVNAGHGAVQAVLPRPADPAVPRGRPRAEVRPHAGHRRGRQDHPARARSSRWLGNFSFGDYFKEDGDPVRLGAADQAASGRRLRLRPRTGCGSPCYRDDDEAVGHLAPDVGVPTEPDPAPRHGRQLLVRWACPGRAARARRSTTTAAPSTAARAARSSTRTATWRSGTSSSCSTCRGDGPGKEDFDDPRRAAGARTSTPAWAWSGWRRPAGRRQHLRDRRPCRPVLDRARGADRAEVRPTTSARTCALRVVADHVRTAVMLVGDGVLPSNEGARLRAAPDPAAQRPRNLRLLAGWQRGGSGGSQDRGGHGALPARADRLGDRRARSTSTPSCAGTRPNIHT